MTQSQRSLLAIADMSQGEFLIYLEDEYTELLNSSDAYQAMDSLIETAILIEKVENITPKQFNYYRQLYLMENPYTTYEVTYTPQPIAEPSEYQLSMF